MNRIYLSIIMFSFFSISLSVFSADSRAIVESKILEGAKIVDVRNPEEYAEGNYKGSINIPLSQIPKRLKDFGDPAKPILVYCRSGKRSSEAKKILIENGFSDITDGGRLSDLP